MACRKEREDKYAREKAEAERQVAEHKAKFEREEQERAAKIKAIEEKNNVALSDLAALKKSVAAQEEIDSRSRQQKYAAEMRYKELEDKANSDYAALLDKIQEAEKRPTDLTDDDFWNETILPANYLPVQNKEGLWGFTNKQGKQALGYQYQWASPFSKGAALVRLNDKERNYALIDTKGNVIKEFDQTFFNNASKGATKVTGFEYKSFTDGILVVRFYTSDYTNKNIMGCLNRKGAIVMPPSYASIDSFKNGTARASLFLKEENSKIEWDYPGHFWARYGYYDVGIIDQTGNWISATRKKLEYNSGFYSELYLTVEDSNDKRTYAQKEADKIRFEQEKKVKSNQLTSQLEAQVAATVNAAKAQGMLTEKK
ncbi:MAG: WG repeat-containing protein [Bacteroidota bacterium]